MTKSTLELILEQVQTGKIYVDHAYVNLTRDIATLDHEATEQVMAIMAVFYDLETQFNRLKTALQSVQI